MPFLTPSYEHPHPVSILALPKLVQSDCSSVVKVPSCIALPVAVPTSLSADPPLCEPATLALNVVVVQDGQYEFGQWKISVRYECYALAHGGQ